LVEGSEERRETPTHINLTRLENRSILVRLERSEERRKKKEERRQKKEDRREKKDP